MQNPYTFVRDRYDLFKINTWAFIFCSLVQSLPRRIAYPRICVFGWKWYCVYMVRKCYYFLRFNDIFGCRGFDIWFDMDGRCRGQAIRRRTLPFRYKCLWEWDSMSKNLYNENKIWQIQIVALVDTGTVPEVPGPLGEHLISKTTIYFWKQIGSPLCSLWFCWLFLMVFPFLEVTTDFLPTFSGIFRKIESDEKWILMVK